MRPMIRCTGVRRAASSTATTTTTATCRSTSSAAEHLLCAKLRPANIDGAAGAKEEVTRIVEQIRARWPETRIILRADSGFAREGLMAWCEGNGVDDVFGLARNRRLERWLQPTLERVAEQVAVRGQAARHARSGCARLGGTPQCVRSRLAFTTVAHTAVSRWHARPRAAGLLSRGRMGIHGDRHVVVSGKDHAGFRRRARHRRRPGFHRLDAGRQAPCIRPLDWRSPLER